ILGATEHTLLRYRPATSTSKPIGRRTQGAFPNGRRRRSPTSNQDTTNMETDFHIGYPLSRWARRYVASLEESATFRCVRERSRTCSRAELQALLQHYQLPM